MRKIILIALMLLGGCQLDNSPVDYEQKYVVMCDYPEGSFSKKVQQFLDNGYELVGGVAVKHTGLFCQTLIKGDVMRYDDQNTEDF